MNQPNRTGLPTKQGLYDPAFEKDSCGVGFVAHIKGQRSHQIVADAHTVLLNMDHRGACGCEPNTGDGAGILTALPYEFLEKVAREELHTSLPEPGSYGAGIVFLPTDSRERETCKRAVESITLALEESCRLQCRLSVETRTNAYQIRTGDYPEDQISVYFTVRQYWGTGPERSFVDSFRRQCEIGEEMVQERIIPRIVQPLGVRHSAVGRDDLRRTHRRTGGRRSRRATAEQ